MQASVPAPPGRPFPPPGHCLPARYGAAWAAWGAPSRCPRNIRASNRAIRVFTNHETRLLPGARRKPARIPGFSRNTKHETRNTAFFRITAFVVARHGRHIAPAPASLPRQPFSVASRRASFAAVPVALRAHAAVAGRRPVSGPGSAHGACRRLPAVCARPRDGANAGVSHCRKTPSCLSSFMSNSIYPTDGGLRSGNVATSAWLVDGNRSSNGTDF